MIFIIFVMYTDINGQKYKLKGDKAIIQQNLRSTKIEIFPTITVEDKEYEVVFPDNCMILFRNRCLEEFKLHKLLHETTNVTRANGMFTECVKLKELDLTNFNTDNLVNMAWMFCECISLTCLNISNFNTKNVKNMFYAFAMCYRLKELKLGNFIITDKTEVTGIFSKCHRLTQICLSDTCIYNHMDPKASKFFKCGCINLINIQSINKKINAVIETAKKLNIEIDNKIVLDYKQIMKHNKFIIIKTIVANCNASPSIYDVNCDNSYIK